MRQGGSCCLFRSSRQTRLAWHRSWGCGRPCCVAGDRLNCGRIGGAINSAGSLPRGGKMG
jgi:hypothetical protein